MNRFRLIACVLLVAAPLTALLPLGRMAADWAAVARAVEGPVLASASERSFDGVRWTDAGGVITAQYVFPGSPADTAGIEAGDEFYMLEYQQYFTAADLQRVIEGIPPGQTRTYYVRRGAQFAEVPVTLARYPTFLYPLSGALWHFALWAFTLGAFFHVLGLLITSPLAWRSRGAWRAFLLIGASALWVFSAALRLVLVEGFGLPMPDTTYDAAFRTLTLVGLVGWIGFPALLLNKVAQDTQAIPAQLRWLRLGVFGPTALLALAAGPTVLGGRLGPLTPGQLVAPILFCACCYVAAAAALMLAFDGARPGHAGPEGDADRRTPDALRARDDDALQTDPAHRTMSAAVPDGWNRAGSALLLAGATLLGLCVLGVVPLFGAVTDVTAGWIVVAAQLLSVAPVVLVTLATLRRGKPEQVLSRALTYLTALGLIFFAFVGGLSFIHPYVPPGTAAYNLVTGAYVVALLVLFERLARRLRIYVEHVFATDRQRARQRLSRFQEHMRTLMDHETLARQTVSVVGKAFGAQSARLFIRPDFARPDARDGSEDTAWISGAYDPQPPYFTERVLERIWPYVEREGRIWSSSADLCESTLPEGRARLLTERGAALAIPIMGDGAPTGLLVLGPKRARRAVYNLEDLDLLRSLSGQLALAVERLNLVVRERALVRETAEAELVALRAQINPHFLFNALNTIVALIAERPGEAEAVVEHLAAIFRYTLHAEGREFVSLEDEFRLAQHYLAIEQARFGDKLTVEVALPAALQGHPVPAFAVQTLVENAVKHGIGQQRQGGRVRLAAAPGTEDAGAAAVTVTDTGVGIAALFGREAPSDVPERFFGIGLRNVAARLERLYGRPGLLRLRSDPDAGTTARLLLPAAPSAAPFPPEDASKTEASEATERALPVADG